MTLRDLTIVDEENRQAMIVRHGSCWAVLCVVVADPCSPIIGYATRAGGIRVAEWHLRWHANGKPTCQDCGQWLAHRTAKRCRKGTCDVDR